MGRDEILPNELLTEPLNPKQEQLLVGQMLCVALVIVVMSAPLFAAYGSYLINLKLPEDLSYWHKLMSSGTLYAMILTVALAVIWVVGIRLDYAVRRSLYHIPIAALLALLILIVLGFLFEQPRFQWFYLEAINVRVERYSYIHSIAYWKLNAMNEVREENKKKIVFIGSSQVNIGVDEQYLAASLDQTSISKYVLPGFGIMQYLMIEPDLIRMHPNAVICWLSEFDVFREDEIPANRLRSFSSFSRSVDLFSVLQPHHIWINRAKLGDILMGAATPVWRDRDLERLLFFKFWWPAPTHAMTESLKGTSVRKKEIAAHIVSLRRNIHRTSLLEANFKAFRRFAVLMHQKGIQLYVFEGGSNPEAMSSYDPVGSMHRETNKRFTKMAEETGFVYIPSSQMPVFVSNDFADAVHLNANAKKIFSRYLASYLRNSVQ